MENNALVSLCGRCNFKSKSVTLDNAAVANLSAAFCIERGGVKHKCYIIVLGSIFFSFAVNDNRLDFSFGFKSRVTYKFSLFNILCSSAAAFPSLCACALMSCSCTKLLFLYKLCPLLLVNGKTFFLKELLCEVNREAVCVGKLECVLAA